MVAHAAPMGVPRCITCGYAGEMYHVTKISTGGWILFVVLLLGVCTLPICWIPLLAMKDRGKQCPQCHTLVGGGMV